MDTKTQYWHQINRCKDLFLAKNKDYGSAWRILRTTSLTDQIYIKAARIRSIQEKGDSRIAEGEEEEFVGIINYCVMALIQLEMGVGEDFNMDTNELEGLYDHHISTTYNLMDAKNDDYDEVWRDMRVSSMTDLILMKLLRVKSIEDNKGKTVVSEGLDANYMDMINYAVFCLILLEERKQ